MVLSSAVPSLDRRPDGWWWNPEAVAWPDAIGRVLPQGGRVAVPGGRRVFDLFLALGYDAFHLTRAEGVRVGEGVSLFSASAAGDSAEAVLARHGLSPDKRRIIDPHGPVSLTVWRRP